jgi:hypothetical protein
MPQRHQTYFRKLHFAERRYPASKYRPQRAKVGVRMGGLYAACRRSSGLFENQGKVTDEISN